MKIDPKLLEDCHDLGRLEHAGVLLHRNAGVGWIILVPDTDAIDWHELGDAEHRRVAGQVHRLSAFTADWFKADKMNIASLGNSVRQMHIHVIARHVDDACWPYPVWGRLDDVTRYSDSDVRALQSALADALSLRDDTGARTA